MIKRVALAVAAVALAASNSFGTPINTSDTTSAAYIAFTTGEGKDTYNNVLANGQFVVNLPAWDRRQLEQVRVCGLEFASDVNELEKAGLSAMPAKLVRPPRIADFGRDLHGVAERRALRPEPFAEDNLACATAVGVRGVEPAEARPPRANLRPT